MASTAEVKVPANVPCCVCGGTESGLVFEKGYPLYGYPGPFALRRCAGCGLLFNSPRLTEEGTARLYGANYYFFRRRPSEEFRRIQEMWERTIALVGEMVPRREVLEIGSAKGFLLAVMQGAGWKVQGVELSPFAAGFARERLRVPTFTGRVENFVEEGGGSHPLVLAIDVVEHVLDPPLFVGSLARLVEPGGLLLIDTPNGAAANIELLGEAWKGFNPFHVYLFSVENLSRLLAEHGFVVEASFSYGNAPACPGEAAASAPRARQLARAALETAGVIEPLRRGRDAALEALDRAQLERLVRESTAAVRRSRAYSASEDARLPLAEGCRGDNIVVVARKL
ncbi:MAG TPA: class I SAM-dependent methyltransferase [Longimicrobiaceae bacterium]|nr:class I SAM-dependent methyltransferase [Longimicrobiaceae bacterium]